MKTIFVLQTKNGFICSCCGEPFENVSGKTHVCPPNKKLTNSIKENKDGSFTVKFKQKTTKP